MGVIGNFYAMVGNVNRKFTVENRIAGSRLNKKNCPIIQQFHYTAYITTG